MSERGLREAFRSQLQLLAASTVDQLVAYYVPATLLPMTILQYVGAKAVHADVDKFSSKTKDLKGDFIDLRFETDGTMGVAHNL